MGSAPAPPPAVAQVEQEPDAADRAASRRGSGRTTPESWQAAGGIVEAAARDTAPESWQVVIRNTVSAMPPPRASASGGHIRANRTLQARGAACDCFWILIARTCFLIVQDLFFDCDWKTCFLSRF